MTRTKRPSEASYDDIVGPDGYLVHCQAFSGGTMSAKIIGDYYHVYSYDEEIARVNLITGEKKFSSPAKERKKTKDHQMICAMWLGDGSEMYDFAIPIVARDGHEPLYIFHCRADDVEHAIEQADNYCETISEEIVDPKYRSLILGKTKGK